MYCDIIPRIKRNKEDWENSSLFTDLLKSYNRATAVDIYSKIHSTQFMEWFGADWTKGGDGLNSQGEPILVDNHFTNLKGDKMKVVEVKNKTTKAKVYGDTIASIFSDLRWNKRVLLDDSVQGVVKIYKGDLYINPDNIKDSSTDGSVRLFLTSIMEGSKSLSDLREKVKEDFPSDIKEVDENLSETERIDTVFLDNFRKFKAGSDLDVITKRITRVIAENLKVSTVEANTFIDLLLSSKVVEGKDTTNASSITSLRAIKDLKNQPLTFDFTSDLTHLDERRRGRGESDESFYQEDKEAKDQDGNKLNTNLRGAGLTPLGRELRDLIANGEINPSNITIISKYPRTEDIALMLGVNKHTIVSLQDPKVKEKFPVDQKDLRRTIIESKPESILISPNLQSSNSIAYGHRDTVQGELTQAELKQLVNINAVAREGLKIELKDLENLTRQGRTVNPKAKARLRKVLEELQDMDSREQFYTLSNKGVQDLTLLDSFLSNDDNFRRGTSIDLDKEFAKMPRILELYGSLDKGAFTKDDKKAEELRQSLNILLERVENRLDERMVEYMANNIAESTTNKDFKDSPEEVKKELKRGKDIGGVEKTLRALAVSGDLLLAMFDKEYKRVLAKIKKSTIAGRSLVVGEIERLVDAGITDSKGKASFTFMMDRTDGSRDRYVEIPSASFGATLDALKEKTLETDEDGTVVNKKFREISYKDLQYASKEDIAHNIKLAEDKEAESRFKRPENYNKKTGKFEVGENVSYTSQFLSARAKVEYFDSQNFEWKKIATVSESAYQEYLVKYYEEPISYNKAIRNKDGYTGAVERAEVRPVRPHYKTVTPKWYSDGYKAIVKDKAKLRFYNFFVDQMHKQLSYLPKDVEHSMRGRIPISAKYQIDKILDSEDKAKTILKEFKNSLTPEAVLGEVRLDENGRKVDSIPIMYVNSLRNQEKIDSLKKEIEGLDSERDSAKITDLNRKLYIEEHKLEPEDVNQDLGDGLLKFMTMGEKYRTLTSFESVAKNYQRVADRKTYLVEDEKGLEMGGKTYREVKGLDKDTGERSKVSARLQGHVKEHLYKSIEGNDGVIAVATKKLMAYSSYRNMALNFTSGVTNALMGKIAQRIEAHGGQFFNNTHYKEANKEVNSYLASFEFLKEQKNQDKAETKITAAIVDLGLLQDQKELILEANEGLKGTFKDLSWMFLLQEAGEWDNQSRLAVAMLKAEMLKVDDGTEVSVWDSHELRDGRFKLKPSYEGRVKFDETTRADLSNKVIGVNQKVHGNYTAEEKSELQHKWYGQLAFHYKKWLVPSFDARFRKKYHDERLGVEMEGRYLTVAAIAKRMYKLKSFSEIRGKTDLEVANMRQVAMEAALFLGTLALFFAASALSEGIDPEEDPILNKINNFFISQTVRVSDEMSTFFNILQLYKVAKSPFAALGMLKELGELSASMVSYAYDGTIGEEKDLRYQRGHNKGRLKVSKEFMDILPILRMYNVYLRLEDEQTYFVK